MECIATKKKTSILRLSSSLTCQNAMHCCQEGTIHPDFVFSPNLPSVLLHHILRFATSNLGDSVALGCQNTYLRHSWKGWKEGFSAYQI